MKMSISVKINNCWCCEPVLGKVGEELLTISEIELFRITPFELLINTGVRT
jgi:hypothetical protein